MVGRVDRLDLPERPVVDLAVDRPLRHGVPPAETGHELGALLLRLLRRRDHAAKTGHVGRHRLLAEDVLAGVHRLLEMIGAESGGRREDDDVDAAVEDVVDRVEADELPAGIDHDPVLVLLLESVEAPAKPIGVHVAHRPEEDAGIGADRLARRPGAAAAAPDQPDLESLTRGRRAPDGHREPRHRAGPDDRGALHERPTTGALLAAALGTHGFSCGDSGRRPACLRVSERLLGNSAQGSQTTRTPTQSLEASHQMLLGTWGSSMFQSVVNGLR